LLPNFLVIGAPRSGTTWIDENLRCHPDVFMPKRKELHFFDRHFDRGLPYYESLFADWAGQKAAGEATPDYLHGVYSKNNIPAHIKKCLPNVKLIACLRNPVERAYSRYWNSKAKFDHNAKLTFEDKLHAKPEFIQEGFYFDQLVRFLELFPSDQMLVLLYDDIRDRPGTFMKDIYEFIGVDPSIHTGFEHARINTAAGKRNLAKSRLLWYVSRALSRANLHTAATRLSQFNSKPIPTMTPETRQRLIEVYRESNQKLGQLINRDLSIWNG